MFGKNRLACSFCGKKDDDVAKLVAGPRVYRAGPRVYICDECVTIAIHLMQDATPVSNMAPTPASPR
jgi:ATP-dependent Clp protease ATP-binding subunit ClpX